jgi:hypothetical protein
MKRFSIHIILFTLPILIGVVMLFMIPVDKKFSYNFVKGECDNKASWIYRRIFEDERPIDIAFTGASQTSCAIMDQWIENELTSQSTEKIEVANLGYCRRGRDIQYVMLKELFRHKQPSVLVIEVAEDEPKKSHPVFPYLAENGDLFGSFVMFNQRYFKNIVNGAAVRFEQLKEFVFKNDHKTEIIKNGFGYLPSTQLASTQDFVENSMNWQERNSKIKPRMLREAGLNFSKHYVKKIVQLAQNHNCHVVFLYLPESGSEIKKPLLIDFYKKFGELIILPESIISDHANWKDATHFNNSGAKKTSAFIVKEFANFYSSF